MANIKIENFDNRPWIPHHIPSALRKEFYRRTLDTGINFTNSTNAWSDDYKKYKGPLSAWARITSNGTGITKNQLVGKTLSADEVDRQKRKGFVFLGGQGFNDAYGSIANNPANVLGYDVYGEPHKLNISTTATSNHNSIITLNNGKTTSPLLPPPGIISIETSIQKERIRKATINWRCYSFAQLEYLIPYFLTPGISVIVEFGWSHFNHDSLLNLRDETKLKELFHDGSELYDRAIQSNGMYDVTFGILTNFDFSYRNGLYECKSEIYSKHRNHTGAFLNEAPKTTDISDNTGKPQTLTKPSFYDFCNLRLKKITKCLMGSGLNFFDPLDDSEKKKNDDKSLKSKFFGGQVENRIFLARGKINDDPYNKYIPQEHDWDKESPDETWVTMGFVVELLNLFIGQEINTSNTADTSDPKNEKLYVFDIEDVIIGGHPNLLSSDGYSVLIPNPTAPKYNLGSKYWLEDYTDKSTGEIDINGAEKNKLQKQTYSKADDGFNTKNLVNKKVYSVFKTGYAPGLFTNGEFINQPTRPSDLGIGLSALIGPINTVAALINPPQEQKADVTTEGTYRDNIDLFINRFRYSKGNMQPMGSCAFPQQSAYTKNGNYYKAGYWGYLKDIYINVNTVIDLAHNSKTSEDFLNSLLDRLCGSVAGFWELSVIEDEKKLKIIDKKIISSNIYKNIFQFDISSDSVIKSVSFSATPSNAQMNQIIGGSSNNSSTHTGVATSNEMPDFYYGDRLGINKQIPDKKQSFINESSNTIKQYQKYGKTKGTFNVSLYQTSAPTDTLGRLGQQNSFADNLPRVGQQNNSSPDFYKVYNLALPNNSLLLSILNCEDFDDNPNIYGGQQPNFICEIEMQGISGLRTFQCFSLKNIPKPYSEEDIIFQIIDVSHVLQNGDWTTLIKAGIRPARKIKVIPDDGKSSFEASNEELIIKNKS